MTPEIQLLFEHSVMRQFQKDELKMTPRSKKLFAARTAPINNGFSVEKQLFNSCTAPIQLMTHIYGIFPATIKDGKIELSLFYKIYGTALVLTTSLARIYLEPSKPGEPFFIKVFHYKNIFMPVSCILSMAFMSFKLKKLIACLNALFSLCHYMTARQMKQTFYLQIVMIFAAYFCFTFTNSLLYWTHPELFVGKFLALILLDYHLSVTLWLMKLEFFLCFFFTRNILVCIRRDILSLQTVGTPFQIRPMTANLNPLVSLFEEVVKLSECLNESFGVTLGVASLLTALNCITTAYFQLSLQGDAVEWVLISWLIIDVTQQWLVLTAAELFTREVRLTVINTQRGR